VFRVLMTDQEDEDIERQLRASFGRMRSRASREAPAIAGTDVDDRPAGEPSVPAKLFVGPNATWYDDRWRWMDWRGKSRSWNSAAALTFGAWFAYRRMYGWLVLYLVWISAMLLALMSGVPAVVPLGLQVTVMIAAGLYGNTLYLRHFRRVARDVAQRQGSHEAQLTALAEAGGVTPRVAYAVPAGLIALALGIGWFLDRTGEGPTISF
jgi:hypothetical protein